MDYHWIFVCPIFESRLEYLHAFTYCFETDAVRGLGLFGGSGSLAPAALGVVGLLLS